MSPDPVVVIQREDTVEYRSVFSVICVSCGAAPGQPCTSPAPHKICVRHASYKPVPSAKEPQ